MRVHGVCGVYGESGAREVRSVDGGDRPPGVGRGVLIAMLVLTGLTVLCAVAAAWLLLG